MGNQQTPNPKPYAINVNAELIHKPSIHQYQLSSSLASSSLAPTHSTSISESWLDIKLDHPTASPTPTCARLSSVSSNRPLTPLTFDTVSPLPILPQESPTEPEQKTSPFESTNVRRRNSSYSHVNNGITGTHISSRICKIAAKFWQHNIEKLPMDEQLVRYLH